MQSFPRSRPRGAELGVQSLFRLAHLMGCAQREDVEWAAVFGYLAADAGECVDAERADPIGEAGEQRLPLRVDHVQLAGQTLGGLVEAVGRDRGVDVRGHHVATKTSFVERANDGVGGSTVCVGHRSWVALADVVLVEQRDQAIGVGADLFHGVGERP